MEDVRLPPWLEAELPFEHAFVSSEGWRIHVMLGGPPDGFPCVLMHGNPTWGFLNRKIARGLEGAGLRVIMPDLLGLGLSEKPQMAETHALDHHGAVIAGALDALGVERAIVCVQDWGGPIGVLAAAASPGRLAGLCVLNTVLSEPKPGFRPTLFHRLAHGPLGPLIFRGLGFPQNALWAAQGDRRSIRGVAARAYRWPLTGLRNNVAPLALARMVPNGPSHPSVEPLCRVREVVQAFEGPAAIVWGHRDPVLGSAFNWIRKLVPHALVTETEGGHFLQEEAHVEIASAIRGIAARLGEGGA